LENFESQSLLIFGLDKKTKPSLLMLKDYTFLSNKKPFNLVHGTPQNPLKWPSQAIFW
jgi:hypothetical protein